MKLFFFTLTLATTALAVSSSSYSDDDEVAARNAGRGPRGAAKEQDDLLARMEKALGFGGKRMGGMKMKMKPTTMPTPSPTDEPTPSPTDEPTPFPTDEPTPSPTDEPTPFPTDEPTPFPTKAYSFTPTTNSSSNAGDDYDDEQEDDIATSSLWKKLVPASSSAAAASVRTGRGPRGPTTQDYDDVFPLAMIEDFETLFLDESDHDDGDSDDEEDEDDFISEDKNIEGVEEDAISTSLWKKLVSASALLFEYYYNSLYKISNRSDTSIRRRFLAGTRTRMGEYQNAAEQSRAKLNSAWI